MFLSISYLANCFWYLTHSSSNVIWLKLKFSILLLIISVLGVLGSVPDCSETIFCMMSFNLVGRIVLRNWKTIDFYWFWNRIILAEVNKCANSKWKHKKQFSNYELTLGFKKTYMIGFQKQFLWKEIKNLNESFYF